MHLLFSPGTLFHPAHSLVVVLSVKLNPSSRSHKTKQHSFAFGIACLHIFFRRAPASHAALGEARDGEGQLEQDELSTMEARRRAPVLLCGPSQRTRILAVLLLFASASSHAATPARYHSSGDILHWFSHGSFKYPQRMKFREVQDEATQVLMPLATLTDYATGADATTTSGDSNTNSSARPQVLLVFAEHAREVITSEVAIWLTRVLVDDASAAHDWPELHAALERAEGASAADAAGGWPATIRAWTADALRALTIQIVPIEAVEARRHLERGHLCVRKSTRNDVDLNRNWPFAWQRERDASSEQYGGAAPMSEAQPRLLRALSEAAPTLAFANVHSGEWAAYTPWDSKPGYAPGLPDDLPQLAAKVGAACRCRVGPAGAASGYLAMGTSMDWMYAVRKVRYPLTFEVYGGGGEGLLPPGASNKALGAWPLLQAREQGGGGGGARRLLLQRLHQQRDARRLAGAAHRRTQQQLPQQPASGGDDSGSSTNNGGGDDLLMRLYGEANAQDRACFEAFNPVEEADYRRAVADWLAVALVTLRHVAAAAARDGGGADGG